MPLKHILRNILLAILVAQFLILVLLEIYGIFIIKEGSFILYFLKGEIKLESFTFTPWFGLSVVIGHLFGYLFPHPNEPRFYLLPILLWLFVVVLLFTVFNILSYKKGGSK